MKFHDSENESSDKSEKSIHKIRINKFYINPNCSFQKSKMKNLEFSMEHNLNLLTQEHKDLYYSGSDDESETVEWRFMAYPGKSLWCSKGIEKMTCTPRKEGYIYSPNMKLDFLEYTILYTQTSILRVKNEFKDQVRIAWDPKFALALVKEAIFSSDGSELQTFNKRSMEYWYQYYVREKETFNRMSGNIERLTSFRQILPVEEIIIPQPWSYYKKESQAFPLFLAKKSVLQKEYFYDLNPLNFIRMQIRKKSYESEWTEWSDCKVSSDFLEDYENIPVPDLYASYSKVSANEKDEYVEKFLESPAFQYLDTFSVFETDRKYKSGENISIKFHISNPIKSFFWTAEDQERVSLNKHFYYSIFSKVLEKNEINDDDTPLKEMSFKYGALTKYPMVPDSFFNKFSSYKYFGKNIPEKNCYNSFSQSSRPDYPFDMALCINTGEFNAVLKTERDILKKYGLWNDKKIEASELLSVGFDDEIEKNDVGNIREYNVYLCLQQISKIKFSGGYCTKV